MQKGFKNEKQVGTARLVKDGNIKVQLDIDKVIETVHKVDGRLHVTFFIDNTTTDNDRTCFIDEETI